VPEVRLAALEPVIGRIITVVCRLDS